ncbi:flavodoxin domain-containing protein [Couchioplanes caeruleus]|uniref:flavodoxin domain-containing protein n=1 Tax=Couchioplanes caeruleus TaxID=56438 RepID=UPI0020BDE897|nr:flavodoxin domain-containing protein [Couchioplanes caeruleus]UQU67786.1 flavodoxin domain-containing protein [Couchioplanes caeruleus]
MTVLVAYGSTGGSTAETAGWIADELGAAGLGTRLVAAGAVDDVDGYEALVLGAAMYAAGWHTDARRFARRFAGRFAGRPVWLFSSGPLDHTADDSELPPNRQAEVAMRLLQARGHVTFGGRLSAEAHGWLGLLARRMEHDGHSGDFRNPDRVRAWARGIAAEITSARTG